MKSRRLPCEYPDCGMISSIRSKIRNRDSEHYGLYVCPFHASLERAPKPKSAQTLRTEKARKEQRKDYPEFYQKWCEFAARTHCKECGSKLRGLSTEVVHILAKSTSPEVATNDLNILLLCGDCHTRFDSTLEKRSHMKCFDESVHQYVLLEPFIENITAETTFYEKHLHMSK